MAISIGRSDRFETDMIALGLMLDVVVFVSFTRLRRTRG